MSEMTISVCVKKEFNLNLPLQTAYDALYDIKRTGCYLPGVDRISDAGDDQFEWFLDERKIFGVHFQGQYTTKYHFSPGRISWDTVSGNMVSRGFFAFEPQGCGTRLVAELHNGLPLKVPPLARAAVEMFVHQQMAQGLSNLMKQIELAPPNPAMGQK